MRLTLRTLLAYMDDRLSSANAREIGRKLKESPFAQDLADRIGTVMRQRRLTTPGRKVKMIDPNLIAEYLDDQLTPELVALIEKEVLSSDFSLAEVAASHQILGLLGDPVELDDRLRQRLHKQSPYRSEEESTDHEMDQMDRKQLSDPSQEIWNPMERQRPFSPKSPALILAALLIGWVVLLMTDGLIMGRNGDQQTARTEVDSPEQQDAGTSDDDAADNTEETGTEPETEEPEDETDSTAVEEPPTPDSTEPDDTTREPAPVPPADDTTETAVTSTPPAPEPQDPETPEPTPADEPETPDTPTVASDTEDTPPPPAPNVPEQRHVFEYTVDDPGRMLLSRSEINGEWSRTAAVQGDSTNWHDVLTEQVTALSEPFIAGVSPVDQGWTATFVAPCLFRTGDGFRPQLYLYDGRCIVTRNVLNELQPGAGFDVVAGGVTVRCTPEGEDFRLGLLVVPIDAAAPPEGTESEEPESEEQLPLQSDATVSLFVAGGSVAVQTGDSEPLALGNGRVLQWVTRAGQPQNVSFSEPTQLDAVPDWVHTAGDPGIPEIEQVKGRIAREFEGSDSPVDTARQLCSGRNPLTARYAASVLSVTRAVDPLVQVLLQTDEEQVRIETIYGIRQAAAQTLPGWRAVSRALENRLPRRDLEDFVALLRGLTQEEAEDEGISLWLVSMLSHDRAAIRQLAFMNLVELTGERNGYHPDSDRSKRNDAIRRWERWLKRNNNRLLTPQ